MSDILRSRNVVGDVVYVDVLGIVTGTLVYFC